MLQNVTVFDFETSGLDPEHDRVIELAAIKIIDGKIVDTFSTLINQPLTLKPKITEITGIKTEDLKEGMQEVPAFQRFVRMMLGSTLVAHNATFDLSFLHFTLMRLAGGTFNNKFLDTLTIARDRYAYPHTLGVMCEQLGIDLIGAHRALNDVIACWELLKRMHELRPVDTYLNTLGYLNKYGEPKWAPSYAKVIGMDLMFGKKYKKA